MERLSMRAAAALHNCTRDENSTCALSNYTNVHRPGWFAYGQSLQVSTTFGALSCVGNALIILSFVIWPQLRKATSRQILIYVSICDFGSCLINAISGRTDPGQTVGLPCQVEAFFWIIFTLGFVLWSTCMSIYLYMSIARDGTAQAKRYVKFFHLVCWGVPVVVSSLAFGLGGLGNSSLSTTVGWCWIGSRPLALGEMSCSGVSFLWMMVTLKGWECVSYFVIPILYALVLWRIRQETSGKGKLRMGAPVQRAIRGVNIKLAILPVCFVLMRVWGTVRVFTDALQRSCKVELSQTSLDALEYMQAVGDNSQGIVNFILFVCLTAAIRQGVVQRLRSAAQILCICHSPGYTTVGTSTSRESGNGSTVNSDAVGEDDEDEDDNDLENSMALRTRTALHRHAASPTGSRHSGQQEKQLLRGSGGGRRYGT